MSAITPLTGHYLRAHPVPEPKEGSKETRGRVLVVAGSREVPGAALLSGTAVLRAGAGKLQVATVRSAAMPLALALPEARVVGLDETEAGGIARDAGTALGERAARCQAVLIGPGMTEDADTDALVASLLAGAPEIPVILDAAAMRAARDPALARGRRYPLVLTPHAGEMAQLLDRSREAIEADPVAAAREAAERFRAIVVMKGATTQIAAPEGEMLCYREGQVGLATSGSGDVLAGFIAAFLARGAPPLAAAAWGVFVHGEAGRRLGRRIGRLGFLAREIAGEAPGLLVELTA